MERYTSKVKLLVAVNLFNFLWIDAHIHYVVHLLKLLLFKRVSLFFFPFSFSILVNMDDRMVEQFVDEDDFIINLDFDNQLGHFELTLQY